MGLLQIIRKTLEWSGALAAMVFLQELAWHFFFACVMFAIGYTYVKDRHVRVDIVRERLKPHLKARLERLLLVTLVLPLCLVLFWFGADMAWLSFMQDEGSRAALGLSARWIVKSALPVGALLLFLAGIYRLVYPVSHGRVEE